MRVLIVGEGGREHALNWKIAQSELVESVFVAPGNAGTENEPKTQNVDIASDDIDGLLKFATLESIDLCVVGPEKPLVMGISDAFTAAGIKCFGPKKEAAQLEGSKTFAKEFLKRYDIPTAAYQHFDELNPAIEYVRNKGVPIVIKADGLAAGKGVIIAHTEAQAVAALEDILANSKFGDAGASVVIEEFLSGEEASFMCMVADGHVLPLASSQDHKAAYDGDNGPNTGGMGAYSPAPVVDEAMHEKIMQDIILPTVKGLQADGIGYLGFLYAGLMIDKQGEPHVIEFNCRMGDPETQPILMRLKSDLAELCMNAVKGILPSEISWYDEVSLAVVMAAKGYPEHYEKGFTINFSHELDNQELIKVFHSGTRTNQASVLTTGGRVLCACALANTTAEAQELAYAATKMISWEGMWYRKDIGYRAIDRE